MLYSAQYIIYSYVQIIPNLYNEDIYKNKKTNAYYVRMSRTNLEVLGDGSFHPARDEKTDKRGGLDISLPTNLGEFLEEWKEIKATVISDLDLGNLMVKPSVRSSSARDSKVRVQLNRFLLLDVKEKTPVSSHSVSRAVKHYINKLYPGLIK